MIQWSHINSLTLDIRNIVFAALLLFLKAFLYSSVFFNFIVHTNVKEMA